MVDNGLTPELVPSWDVKVVSTGSEPASELASASAGSELAPAVP